VPNTQSKQVNLTKRVRTSNGLRYGPVALSANGRVKPDRVLVNGRLERRPEGAYCLEWREKADGYTHIRQDLKPPGSPFILSIATSVNRHP
jgi:hypothetical protein